jgi:hypothetical protein
MEKYSKESIPFLKFTQEQTFLSWLSFYKPLSFPGSSDLLIGFGQKYDEKFNFNKKAN